MNHLLQALKTFFIPSVVYCLPSLATLNLRITHQTPRKLLSSVNEGIGFGSVSFTTLGWTLCLASRPLFYPTDSLSQSREPHPSFISYEIRHGPMEHKERDFRERTQSFSPAGCEQSNRCCSDGCWQPSPGKATSLSLNKWMTGNLERWEEVHS